MIKLDKLLNLAKPPGGFDLNRWKMETVEEIRNLKIEKSVKEEEKRVFIKEPPPMPKIPQIVKDTPPPSIQVTDKGEKKIEIDQEKIPKKKKIVEEVFKKDYENDFKSDKDYSMWLPPVDQSGDGKTKLNAKFGY